MPDHFFIVGAQRSGTTYLYHLLAEHPQIEMAQPVRPEPKFFLTDACFEQGLARYWERFFPGKPGARLRGEKSTSYMESEPAARRIAQCFPNARMLFLLRDPIERALSNYRFSVGSGLEPLPLEEAFRREDERWEAYDRTRVSVSPYAYLRRGRYIDFIGMYERYFARDQLVVLLNERLVGNAAALQELYTMLGVSPDFLPDSLHRVINESADLPVALSASLEADLVAYYADANAALAQRFGLDLACWRRFA